MARNPNYSISRTYVDASDETSTVALNIQAYNVLNFADVLSDIGEFWDAVDAVSLMNPVSDSITLYATKFSRVLPTDNSAQRERKMLITFQDDVNFTPGKLEIPGPGFSIAPLLPGTDIFDVTDPQLAALITALEQVGRSSDGNAITVTRVVAVGRNL